MFMQVWVTRRIRSRCASPWRWRWNSSRAVTTPGLVFRTWPTTLVSGRQHLPWLSNSLLFYDWKPGLKLKFGSLKRLKKKHVFVCLSRMVVELHRKVSSLIEYLKQKWTYHDQRIVSFQDVAFGTLHNLLLSNQLASIAFAMLQWELRIGQHY